MKAYLGRFWRMFRVVLTVFGLIFGVAFGFAFSVLAGVYVGQTCNPLLGWIVGVFLFITLACALLALDKDFAA